MSNYAINLVWHCARYEGTTLLVLQKMADSANDEAAGIYPRIETIAYLCRIKLRRARQIISLLESDGVAIRERSGRGKGQRAHWRLSVPRLLELGRECTCSTCGKNRQRSAGYARHDNRQPVAGLQAVENRQPAASKPATQCRQNRQRSAALSRSLLDPNKEPSSTDGLNGRGQTDSEATVEGRAKDPVGVGDGAGRAGLHPCTAHGETMVDSRTLMGGVLEGLRNASR